jgi:4-hydroxy-L-threonine phosphate dehydrogenase PdxA
MTKTTAETIPLRVFGRTIQPVTVLFPNPENAQYAKLGLQDPYDAIVKLHECDVTALADLPIVEGTLAKAGVKFATHDEIISLAIEKPELLTEYQLATIVDGKICLVWNTRGYNEINFNVLPGKLIRKEVPLLLVFACKSK